MVIRYIPLRDVALGSRKKTPIVMFARSSTVRAEIREEMTLVISETAVTIYQEFPRLTDAPKKSRVYPHKTLLPASKSLQKKWSFEPHGLSGMWGYIL